jgi:hypothetical protein
MLVMFATTSPSRQGAAAIQLGEEPMPRSPIDPEARSQPGGAGHR